VLELRIDHVVGETAGTAAGDFGHRVDTLVSVGRRCRYLYDN